MYSPYPQASDLVPGMHTNPDAAPPSQGSFNKCQTYAFALALEIMHQRAGSPIRVNRDTLYWIAKFASMGGDNGDNGAAVTALARGLQLFGVPTETTWRDYGDMYTDPPPEIQAQARLYSGVQVETIPYIRSGPARDNTIETLRMLFAQGKPVIATFRLNESFDNNAGGYWDWRQTQWDGSYATGGSSRGDHVVTLLGDDVASGRILAANHWGEHWGDGGFFGFTYDKFLQSSPQRCVDSLQYISACAVQPIPSFNVMTNPVPTALTTEQQQRFATRAIAKLRAAYTANSWPGALGTAELMGLSDKQFEMWGPSLTNPTGHGLPRGIVLDLQNSGQIQMPASFFEPDA